MEVAICDDERVFRQQLKNTLIDYKNEKRIHIDVYEFRSGEALLRSDMVFDVVFMDYQMPGLNGIETARKLRNKNSICSIIFVTSYPEKCIINAFTVQTFRFMIKPIDTEKIYEAIDSYIRQQKMLHPLIVIEDGELKTVHSKDIMYLEGDGKYCWVRTNNGTVHSSKTLAQVYRLLPSHCFYRIHKSYVVNLYCVSEVRETKIFLNNGEIASIGRTRVAEFKRVYMNFVKNYYVRT